MAKRRKKSDADDLLDLFSYGVAIIVTIIMWMFRILAFIPTMIIKFIEWIYNKKTKKKNKKKDKDNSSEAEPTEEKVSTDKSSKNKNEDTEEDDDIVYDSLEDWQKKEVDEGNYDSYNFEEEELEEDDYYNEDDE